MEIIVINSQKGGSGKTMLAKHLSVEAARDGSPVYLIDTDPQGTLSTWHKRRESETPALVDLPLDRLERGLELLRAKGAAYVFIDTASGRLEIAEQLFKLADFVLFPIQDSDDDLSAAPVTIQNIKKCGTPFLFVLTRVKPNTLITAQAVAVLSKHGQVADVFIRDRTGYKARYEKGQTVTEAAPRGTAAVEVSLLWQDIRAELDEETTPNTEEKAHA